MRVRVMAAGSMLDAALYTRTGFPGVAGVCRAVCWQRSQPAFLKRGSLTWGDISEARICLHRPRVCAVAGSRPSR